MKKLFSTFVATAVAFSAFAGEFPDISIAEVKALAESKKAVILDVNGTATYQKGHVPGALDYAAVKTKLASVLPADKNTPIVAYCGGPSCKAYRSAATAAEVLGYKNIKHMSAGLSGWKEAGQELEKSKK